MHIKLFQPVQVALANWTIGTKSLIHMPISQMQFATICNIDTQQ